MTEKHKLFFKKSIYKDFTIPDLPIDTLSTFLKEANLNTYANTDIKRTTSLRPSSKDYHFEKGDLAFHDTYFGTTRFIGEEIVYKAEKPIWGMNYYGFTLDSDITENSFDAILRPALMAGSGNNIPVRGPKKFVLGHWKYTFKVEGNLSNFIGLEQVFKNSHIICQLYCHGGFIK